MKTYIINLPSRKDRLYHIEKELEKLQIKNYEIIEAIFDEVGWIGCFKSHLKCIEKAKNEGLEEIFILEDDAIFDDNAKEKIDKFLSSVYSLNLDWNMLFIGVNHMSKPERIADNILKIYRSYAAHAYIVNKNIYDEILSLSAIIPIDLRYCDLMLTRNVYSIDPMCAYQLTSYSDIEKKIVNYKDEIHINYKKFLDIF